MSVRDAASADETTGARGRRRLLDGALA